MNHAHLVSCAFFGLPEEADIFHLLGIHASTAHDAKVVKRAMRRRYAQLLANPNTATEEANIVKRYLGEVTALLLEQSHQEGLEHDPAPQQLTDLDQSIIAALIAGGGWNSKTRARLVEIAASYSLTVGGLMRILEALAESAREGDGPLTVQRRSEIAIDRTWTAVPTKKSTLSFAEDYLTGLTDKITPDFSEDNPVLTIKLAVVFGSLTFIAFVLALVVLFSDSKKVNALVQLNKTEFPSMLAETPATAHPLFSSYPTFARFGIENEFIRRADEVLLLPEEFVALQSELLNSTRSVLPSTWTYRWNTALQTIAAGWPFADPFLVDAVSAQIVRIVHTADAQKKSMPTILQPFDIPPFHVSAPISIAKRIWFTGTLASLSCETKFTIGTKSLIKKLAIPSVSPCSFSDARHAATALVAVELVDRTEFDSNYLLVWEAWINLVKGSFSRTDASLLYVDAIRNLLDEEIDFSRASDSRKVAGRLVSEIHWSVNERLRDALLTFYTSPSVSSSDLFLLGHLLLGSNEISWFLKPYIVLQEDTLEERIRKAAALELNWPSEVAPETMSWNLQIPAGFSEEIVATWNKTYRDTQILPANAPATLMKLRKMNEAAVSLWIGRPGLAADQLKPNVYLQDDENADELWQLQSPPIDGDWAKMLGRRGIKMDERLDALAELETSAFTDLGHEDARALAQAALTSVYSRVRVAATDRIVSQFPKSKNVAVAILDALSDAKSEEQILTLVAQLTEAILPDQTDQFWKAQSRRALVQHALVAGNKSLHMLDAIAAGMTNSLLSEYLLLRPTALPPSHELSPLDAFTMLIDAWKQKLPDYSIPTRENNNTDGILQSILQMQLLYLEILTIEEAHWRGQNAVELLQTADLGNGTSILEQMVITESKIARHWHVLFQELTQVLQNRQDSP